MKKNIDITKICPMTTDPARYFSAKSKRLRIKVMDIVIRIAKNPTSESIYGKIVEDWRDPRKI